MEQLVGSQEARPESENNDFQSAVRVSVPVGLKTKVGFDGDLAVM
jgi:hypothetical protein